ncbi:MAG: putative manganese-dependent inorganic diphosphatase, partial [Deltaproteobacteria bacterium]
EGMDNVVAARAGDINPQTAFVLDYFDIQPPKYLPDVYPRAKDVMSVDVVMVPEDTPLLKVMEIMREQKVRFIPVLDGHGRPKGVLTLTDLALRYMAKMEVGRSTEVVASFNNIMDNLNGAAALNFLGGVQSRFSVYVGAMAVESFIETLKDKDPRGCAVVVGDRDDIQRSAVEKGIGLLVISGGFSVKEPVLEIAKKNRVSIIISPLDSASTALLVKFSTPASMVCDTEFEKVGPDELVDDIKFRLAKAPGMLVLDPDGGMQGVITKSNVLKPSGTSLILVDHNEMAQAVDGAEQVNIAEVVDHHRIGSFHTTHPIPFICEPVGSTSTIVSELYMRRGAPIKKEIAGLLLAGVISDTVLLKSPTTTERDRAVVRWLEEKSGLDHGAFGNEIFGATASIKKRGPEEAVKGDYKVFEAKGKKFGIGQVETIGFAEFYEEKDKLQKVLADIKKEKELKLSGLLVTDIAAGTSIMLVVCDKEVFFKLDYPEISENVYELKNVISRKKQVAPHILRIFNELY